MSSFGRLCTRAVRASNDFLPPIMEHLAFVGVCISITLVCGVEFLVFHSPLKARKLAENWITFESALSLYRCAYNTVRYSLDRNVGEARFFMNIDCDSW